MAIAILDDGGHLLHFVRMDGATPANAAHRGREGAHRGDVAPHRAASWEERIKAGRTCDAQDAGILPVQGGVPIMVEGSCVGAVGVSGVQSHEDEQIAQAGIDALA